MSTEVLFTLAEELAKPQTLIGTFIETKEQKSLVPMAT